MPAIRAFWVVPSTGVALRTTPGPDWTRLAVFLEERLGAFVVPPLGGSRGRPPKGGTTNSNLAEAILVTRAGLNHDGGQWRGLFPGAGKWRIDRLGHRGRRLLAFRHQNGVAEGRLIGGDEKLVAVGHDRRLVEAVVQGHGLAVGIHGQTALGRLESDP